MNIEEIKALPRTGNQLCPKAPTVGALARSCRGQHFLRDVKSYKLQDGTFLRLCECKFCGQQFSEECAPSGF